MTSLCTHTPTAQSPAISRFPWYFFHKRPLLFVVTTIRQLIWPSFGTLCGGYRPQPCGQNWDWPCGQNWDWRVLGKIPGQLEVSFLIFLTLGSIKQSKTNTRTHTHTHTHTCNQTKQKHWRELVRLHYFRQDLSVHYHNLSILDKGTNFFWIFGEN